MPRALCYFAPLQRLLAHFYVDQPDAIKFGDDFRSNADEDDSTNANPAQRSSSKNVITYWDKLKQSLSPNLPRDLQVVDGQSLAAAQVQQQALQHFWAFLKGLLIPTAADA